jgi:hypothetical protein
VLHHLADPDAGLRALSAALKPGGVIYLMVYAPYGRAGICLLQEYCRGLGIGTSVKEINDLLSVIEALPRHHPLMTLLNASRDFQKADAIADALLNPRDRTYSVPQLLDTLAANGLAFRRWYWQAPYLPQCGAIASTPHAPRLVKLSPAGQYAALELWRGAMTTHSLIVGRDDDARPAPLRFDDDSCAAYVPIRLPSTVCVQERLPAGAAAVLLNRSHPFSDIVLPIDAADKKLFDAIDGHRTIAEIAESAMEAGVAEAFRRSRALFEKLWSHDQVTFDICATHQVESMNSRSIRTETVSRG